MPSLAEYARLAGAILTKALLLQNALGLTPNVGASSARNLRGSPGDTAGLKADTAPELEIAQQQLKQASHNLDILASASHNPVFANLARELAENPLGDAEGLKDIEKQIDAETVVLFKPYQITDADGNRRSLTETEAQEECAKALVAFGLTDKSGSVCMPMQLAENAFTAFERASVKFKEGGKEFKSAGRREKAKRKGRGLETEDDRSETLLFNEGVEGNTSIAATMVVEDGLVSAVVFDGDSITMIQPCIDSKDPRCVTMMTLGPNEIAVMDAEAKSLDPKKEAKITGMEDHHHGRDLRVNEPVIFKIDYTYTKAAAAQLGNNPAVIRQNALMRMQMLNTANENSKLNIRYELAKVTVVDQTFTTGREALLYATDTKDKNGADYRALITTNSEIQDVIGIAWMDALDLARKKRVDSVQAALTWVARLVNAGFVTDVHETGHTLGAGHTYDGSAVNFAARAYDGGYETGKLRTALTDGSAARAAEYSSTDRSPGGKSAGDVQHNNAAIIAIRAPQVRQTLDHQIVDPDPVPVCVASIAATQLGKTVLQGKPGDPTKDTISFIARQSITPNSMSATQLKFMLKSGGFQLINLAQYGGDIPDLNLDSSKALVIKFKDNKTIIINYKSIFGFDKSYTINLAAGQEFSGNLEFGRSTINGVYNVLCAVGENRFALEADFASVPTSSAPSRKPTTTTSRPTPKPTRKPTRKSKASATPTSKPSMRMPTAAPTSKPSMRMPTAAPIVPPTAFPTPAPIIFTTPIEYESRGEYESRHENESKAPTAAPTVMQYSLSLASGYFYKNDIALNVGLDLSIQLGDRVVRITSDNFINKGAGDEVDLKAMLSSVYKKQAKMKIINTNGKLIFNLIYKGGAYSTPKSREIYSVDNPTNEEVIISSSTASQINSSHLNAAPSAKKTRKNG